MPYKIKIELSERDLRHFRRELRKARAAVGIADDDEILAAASDLVRSMHRVDLPDFVAERLDKLDTMLAMLSDPDWPLHASERAPVLSALAYLCDPEDIIPDDIPGIGMLDDAVMIEMVFAELRHEIDAYQDFRTFRKALARRAAFKQDRKASALRLVRKREQLMERMRRRKKKKK